MTSICNTDESVFTTHDADHYTNTSPPVYAEKAITSSTQPTVTTNQLQSKDADTSSATRRSVNGSRESMTSSSLGTTGHGNSSRGQIPISD